MGLRISREFCFFRFGCAGSPVLLCAINVIVFIVMKTTIVKTTNIIISTTI